MKRDHSRIFVVVVVVLPFVCLCLVLVLFCFRSCSNKLTTPPILSEFLSAERCAVSADLYGIY